MPITLICNWKGHKSGHLSGLTRADCIFYSSYCIRAKVLRLLNINKNEIIIIID